MRIATFNIKGGTGKSSISLSLALEYKFGVVTNDTGADFEDVLPENSFLRIEKGEKIPSFDSDMAIIFDLAGETSKGTIELLNMADVILIPTTTKTIDLKPTLLAIQEVENLKKPYFIIANKLKKVEDDLDYIRKVVHEFYPDTPIFPIKQTEAFNTLFDASISISSIIKDKRKFPFGFQYKPVLKQIEDIAEAINLNNSE